MRGSKDTMESLTIRLLVTRQEKRRLHRNKDKERPSWASPHFSDHVSCRERNWWVTAESWRRNSSCSIHCPVLQGKRWPSWKVGWRGSSPWSWSNSPSGKIHQYFLPQSCWIPALTGEVWGILDYLIICVWLWTFKNVAHSWRNRMQKPGLAQHQSGARSY